MGATLGQIIGGAIGFVIGAYAGNPFYGFSVGYAIGGAVDPVKLPGVEGPRLVDRRVQGASYGQPITELHGEGYVRPFLIWARPLREVASTSEVNGQSVTTYTPYLDCAFLLCNGPIIGVKRIKADGRVIYDAGAGGTLTGGLSVSGSFAGTAGEVNIGGGVFTVYFGSDSQLPDTYIQNIEGVDNTPAYRGRAYVRIHSFDLTPYGKRVPVFEFDVVASGSVTSSDLLTQTLPGYQLDSGEPLAALGKGSWYVPSTDRIIVATATSSSSPGLNANDGVQLQIWNPNTLAAESLKSDSWFHIYGAGPIVPDRATGYFFYRHVGELRIVAQDGTKISDDAKLSLQTAGFSLSTSQPAGLLISQRRGEVWISSNGEIHRLSRSALLSGATILQARLGVLVPPFLTSRSALLYDVDGDSTFGSLEYLVAYDTQSITVQVYANSLFSRYAKAIGSPGETISSLVVMSNIWTLGFYNSTTKYLGYISLLFGDVILGVRYLGNSTSYFDVDDSLNAFVVYNDTNKKVEWVNLGGSVLNEVDVSVGVTANGTPSAISWIPQYRYLVVMWTVSGSVIMRWYSVARINSANIEISGIVAEKCSQAGIPVGVVDVSEITETINGIQYDGKDSFRSQIDPLRAVGLFDLGISNGKVKARKRGGAVVKTIKESELIRSDEPGVEFVYNDDRDVPSTVEVGFQDAAADFEVSYQAVVRPSLIDGEKFSVDVPMAISAAQAKRIADVTLFGAEFARRGYVLETSAIHIDIEQYDPFEFEWNDGKKTRLIATNIEYAFPLSVKIGAVEDYATLYGAVGIGVPSSVTPAAPVANNGIQLHMLDIPILRDQDNYPGYYVQASTMSTTIAGATLYESADQGTTYSPIASIGLDASGTTSTSLPNFTGGASWDYISTVNVLASSAEPLESYSDEQIYAGSGLYAIGFELVQAKTATLVSAGVWQLSNLLRGRRGTEWAVGTHVIGERVVRLRGAVVRISNSALNVARLYKAATSTAELPGATPVYFENAQIGVKPLSCSNITATRDGSGNITLLWLRRGRVGSAWGVGYDMPLDESVEKWEVDIMSGSTVKRTLTVFGPFGVQPTVPYLAADQSTDFGGLQAQGTLLVNIYQISAVVGRGYVGSATV